MSAPELPPLSLEDARFLHFLAATRGQKLPKRAAAQLAGISRTLELAIKSAELDGSVSLRIERPVKR